MRPAVLPAFDVIAVALVLLERRGVEDAEDPFADAERGAATALPAGLPIERVDVLQHGDDALAVQPRGGLDREVVGREMRLAEGDDQDRPGMPLADLRELYGSVPIALRDAPHVAARDA